jgi:hypothetical protein
MTFRMTEKAGRFGTHAPDSSLFIMMGLHTESIGVTKKRGNQFRPKALLITVSGLAILFRTMN